MCGAQKILPTNHSSLIYKIEWDPKGAPTLVPSPPTLMWPDHVLTQPYNTTCFRDGAPGDLGGLTRGWVNEGVKR